MKVLIRGAGDIATGIALRLHRSGIKVIMTDIEHPLSVRRTVCFSEAVRYGEHTVEGVRGVLVTERAQAELVWLRGEIPVIVDPEAACSMWVDPDAIVDAILAKRNLGTCIDDAGIVIGIGPGFCAGVDCHAVIETQRGHTLGRVIYEGTAIPDTGVPGKIGGYDKERIVRAPADGVFRTTREIGDMVEADEIVGTVEGAAVRAAIGGCLRGLIADGTVVRKGLKCGDVDPRGVASYSKLASDKALAVGGGVLEAVMHFKALEMKTEWKKVEKKLIAKERGIERM